MQKLTLLLSITVLLCGCKVRNQDEFKAEPPVLIARKESEITVVVSSQSDYDKANRADTLGNLFTQFHVSEKLDHSLAPKGDQNFTGTLSILFNGTSVTRQIKSGELSPPNVGK